jgi:hypothetical protein
VIIVFSCSNDENSRSRRENGPATANVRVLNLQRKENFANQAAALDVGRVGTSPMCI